MTPLAVERREDTYDELARMVATTAAGQLPVRRLLIGDDPDGREH